MPDHQPHDPRIEFWVFAYDLDAPQDHEPPKPLIEPSELDAPWPPYSLRVPNTPEVDRLSRVGYLIQSLEER